MTRDLWTEKRLADRRLLGWIVACAVLLPLWQATQARGEEPPRGELRIEGAHITKLVIEGGDNPHTEELTEPNACLRLPVGTYEVQRIELQGGYTCRVPGLAGLQKVVVMEDTPEVLKVGGPLRQEIKAARRGRMLILSHEILGIGGERYSEATRAKPPRFTVYKGDTAIASGQFEYG